MKVGRPLVNRPDTDGRSVSLAFRTSRELAARLDKRARDQRLTRGELLRRLVEQALR